MFTRTETDLNLGLDQCQHSLTLRISLRKHCCTSLSQDLPLRQLSCFSGKVYIHFRSHIQVRNQRLVLDKCEILLETWLYTLPALSTMAASRRLLSSRQQSAATTSILFQSVVAVITVSASCTSIHCGSSTSVSSKCQQFHPEIQHSLSTWPVLLLQRIP